MVRSRTSRWIVCLSFVPALVFLATWWLALIYDCSTLYISVGGYLFMIDCESRLGETEVEFARGWPDQPKARFVLTRQLDSIVLSRIYRRLGPALFVTGTQDVIQNQAGTPKWADYFHDSGRGKTFSVDCCTLTVSNGPALAIFAMPPLLLLCARGRRRWRARRRASRGLCENCAYDLRGNTSGKCPECGAQLAAKTSEVKAVRLVPTTK